ncbi:methyl-accepting chemotaxis sensory transducer [Caldicellulosiruptor hydrothermalis 108]|uniref:Methyl-accepting chemotaxis sensory transducer n=1 Tax=Caldicellulosiruptor hydrothermalis (strain DSM 18901 / VKM B-2411 / 108) TaxID=632292 RepID=E4QE05_CALH1|nr:methyl-accepting chemotaxis protein [Caldicellulosiruptor hydrothermalis]ADQ07696.1 methyl-accepting chemotaxis sensory transducer [Caldicellulosiruptor hydrothermalis 108]
MNLTSKITKISLVILLIVDPLLLLFSYYIFAGLGNYPIVNILVGYIICVLFIGIPVVFIARLSARKVELGSGYNLPVFLSFLIFFANVLAATLVGVIASKIKPLPEDALALRVSGAIAINMNIIALLLFIYSKVLNQEEFTKYAEKTKISISTKLTVGVLSVSLWVGPVLLKYITIRINLDNATKMNLVLISVIANIILALVLWLINRKILSAVPAISETFSKLAQGNLTFKSVVHSNDEFGIINNKLIETIESLKNLITGVKSTVGRSIKTFENAREVFERLNKDSFENAKAIEKQQSDIQRVAASVEEINASIEELSAQAQSLSDLASTVLSTFQALSEKSELGQVAVETILKTSEMLVEKYSQLRDGVQQLAQTTQNIGDVVKFVRQIAEQTNLLALNAAIEAAKAGETGKGFAVVAYEIRKLAEQTKESTAVINRTISAVDLYSKQLEEQIAVLYHDVEENKKKYTELSEIFIDIIQRIKDLTSLVDNLSAHSEEEGASVAEIASATKEIADSISEISQFSEKIISSTEYNLSQANDLSKQISVLSSSMVQIRSLIEKFKV